LLVNTAMRNSPRSRRHQRGFTLIELLVTMTVMIVMIGIGVPSFRTFTATQRVKSTAYDVATTLLIARSEAVKRNRAVTIAPTTGTDWTTGWAVKDSATVLDQKNAVTGLTITGPASLSYQGNGRIAAAVTFDVGNAAVASARRCVKVDLLGIPSTSSGACS
jgi:type IV fimbrial biogenesis protein FimT